MGDCNPAVYPPPDVVNSSYRTPSQNPAPQRAHQSSPYPPPDICNPAFQPDAQHHGQQRADRASQLPPRSSVPPQEPAPSNADFLIIALFALRLTQRMLTSLPDYTHRGADLNWLSDFLSPYDPAYDLAKLSGGARTDFLATYPRIVSRMKRQDRFPVRFMGMNPAAPARMTSVKQRGLSDAERKEMIDFVDAATEWGSMVPLPREEAESILKMADQRLVC